jgi:MoxR-like ATPase
MPAPTIEDAIDALRKLTPDRQQELAGYIFHLATDEREAEDIDSADLPSVLEGLEQAKRRQFASPERIAEVLGLATK